MPPRLRSEVRDRDHRRPRDKHQSRESVGDKRSGPQSPADEAEGSKMGHAFSSPEAFTHTFYRSSSSTSSSSSTLAKRAKLYLSNNRAKISETVSAKVRLEIKISVILHPSTANSGPPLTVEAPEFGPYLAQPADAGVARAPPRSGRHRAGGGRGAVCSAQERPGHGENICNFLGKTSNHTYLWNRHK